MHDRLATIATTLRLQDATGTSHLQQLEMDPEAHGVAKSARPHIKSLRHQRNRALHGGRGRPAADPSSHSASPPRTATSNTSATTSGSETPSVTTKGNISAANSRPHSTAAGATRGSAVTATASHRRPCHEEVPDEIVNYLDAAECTADPAYFNMVNYQGRDVLIDGIGFGTQSGAKLYRIHLGRFRRGHVTPEFVFANLAEH